MGYGGLLGTYAPDTEVEETDQELQRGGADGESVLQAEKRARGGYVGERAAGEGESAEGEADDGEVLEVPAVAFISGGGAVRWDSR